MLSRASACSGFFRADKRPLKAGALTLDDNLLIIQAAADGLGIAYVPEAFAQKGLKSGRLVSLLADWCPPIPGLTLYFPGNRHMPSALRAFIDVLKEAKGNIG